MRHTAIFNIAVKVDKFCYEKLCFFSSPESLGSLGEYVVYPSAHVNLLSSSVCANIYETIWPFKAKLHMEHLWERDFFTV